MRVVFTEGKNGPIVRRYGKKIGVIERRSPLRPQVGEEWEVELIKDTAPGERRGVYILRPIYRVEQWIISFDKKKNPITRKKSGEKMLEERRLNKKYIGSYTKSSSTVGSPDVIVHQFEPILPADIRVEKPPLGWDLDEVEVPKLTSHLVRQITSALLDAWRQGKPEATFSFPYQHKYGGEIEIRWRGYSFSGFDPEGKSISTPNVAILKDGKWQWAEVRGGSYGYQNETFFVGGPTMVGIECSARSWEEWLAWVDKIYAQAIEEVKATPATKIARRASLDYFESGEETGDNPQWAEEIKQNLLNNLEDCRFVSLKGLSEVKEFGRDVVLRNLPYRAWLNLPSPQ